MTLYCSLTNLTPDLDRCLHQSLVDLLLVFIWDINQESTVSWQEYLSSNRWLLPGETLFLFIPQSNTKLEDNSNLFYSDNSCLPINTSNSHSFFVNQGISNINCRQFNNLSNSKLFISNNKLSLDQHQLQLDMLQHLLLLHMLQHQLHLIMLQHQLLPHMLQHL